MNVLKKQVPRPSRLAQVTAARVAVGRPPLEEPEPGRGGGFFFED